MMSAPPAAQPVYPVIFVGHRIDSPNGGHPRFPAGQEAKARALIADKLTNVRTRKGPLKIYASGAPGADILCHEVCGQIGIESVLCLPMPEPEYAKTVFSGIDSWRTRFLGLPQRRGLLQLSDRIGLPNWLHGAATNPWERGNRWVLEMARTSGAPDVTVVALWDGETEGGEPGGTAHMVRLAQEFGLIDIEIIDTKELLS